LAVFAPGNLLGKTPCPEFGKKRQKPFEPTLASRSKPPETHQSRFRRLVGLLSNGLLPRKAFSPSPETPLALDWNRWGLLQGALQSYTSHHDATGPGSIRSRGIIPPPCLLPVNVADGFPQHFFAHKTTLESHWDNGPIVRTDIANYSAFRPSRGPRNTADHH